MNVAWQSNLQSAPVTEQDICQPVKSKNIRFYFRQSASLKMLMRKLPRTPYPECHRNMVRTVTDGEQTPITTIRTVYSPTISLSHTHATLNEKHITAVTFHLFRTRLHPEVAFEDSISRSLYELMGSIAKSRKRQHRVSALK